MIDFSKKIGKSIAPKQINPIALYDSLDRQASAGPLRDVQRNVLTNWYENHNDDRDVIIKLHTGEGKTLIGLLILQSRLNAGKGPCLYVCPSKHLAEQVSIDAQKFGVKFILDNGGELPLEFTESKQILITHVQRVFNGRTKFGLDNDYTRVGSIVVDDSYACIDSIKSAFAITIKRESKLYIQFLNMFEDSLKHQGSGTYLEIYNNEYSSAIMQVPYWDWFNKNEDIAKFLYENIDDDSIYFSYPLLKDIWKNCTAYITSSSVEIVPDYNLIQRFSSFVNCKQRVLMSATTQDDSFLVKGLGFSIQSILNPISDNSHLWSGEKMILFPSRIDENFTTDYVRRWICEVGASSSISVVALVPSYRLADDYAKHGAHIAAGSNLITEISYLQSGVYGDHAVVFVNRYDGIDLPDNRCRLLIIDSLPSFGDLSDKYEQSCREDSIIVATKVAQKIEQGLGRSVRGEKDYSVILMIGEDLVHFVKTSANQLLFSEQTKKQIELAEMITEAAKEDVDKKDFTKALVEVINQCLKRDEGWKLFYQETMNKIILKESKHSFIDIIEKENQAEIALAQHDYHKAGSIYQQLANSQTESKLEQGWYLQKLAKCTYFTSHVNANNIQKRAHENNPYLMMPEGVLYSPIGETNQTYIQQITDKLRKIGTYDELRFKSDYYLSNLVFGVSANTFEKSLNEVGELLGYMCQRPDKTFKVGPDNLWMTPVNKYFLAFECKNEVLKTRTYITKDEVGQMNNHIGWFETTYPIEKKVSYIHIHMTNVISNKANYNADVRIMTPSKLEVFKENIRGFVREFSTCELTTITEISVNNALTHHKLRPEDFVACYTEKTKVDEKN